MAAAALGAALPPILSEVLAAALPRAAGASLRIAALERRLRQDPRDLRRRGAAVAHYSREAQAALLVGAAAAARLEEPLGRAREHLEYVLRASSDVQLLHGMLTQALGPRLFYELPELTAQYMRRIGLDPECLKEFDTHSEFEERATPYHFANALTILKAAGRDGIARELFDEATSLEWKGQRPIRWQSFHQTPAVYIEGLEHRFVWEGSARLPIAELLEANVEAIQADLQELRSRGPRGASAASRLRGALALPARAPQSGKVPAYPALTESGVWDMVQLFVSRQWREEECRMMPRTAELLRRQLPSADVPYVHYNTEEVVLFLLAPGSRVRLHNGGSNATINVHVGLSGCEGAFMKVGCEQQALCDGRAICFDDGSDHRVWHDGAEERWVLTVRVMHPDLARHPAKFFPRAFTRRTCFETWDEQRASRLGAPAA